MYELPHKLPNDLRLKILEIGKFQENPWNVWIWCQVPGHPPKGQILTIFGKKLQKISCKTFIEKPSLLNFVNLSPIFCPRLHIDDAMTFMTSINLVYD